MHCHSWTHMLKLRSPNSILGSQGYRISRGGFDHSGKAYHVGKLIILITITECIEIYTLHKTMASLLIMLQHLSFTASFITHSFSCIFFWWLCALVHTGEDHIHTERLICEMLRSLIAWSQQSTTGNMSPCYKMVLLLCRQIEKRLSQHFLIWSSLF